MTESKVNTKQLVTCRYCKHTGLVWYRTKKGRWVLATPKLGTFDPIPTQVHFCTKRKNNNSTPSQKASTWRLGKSPSSYG